VRWADGRFPRAADGCDANATGCAPRGATCVCPFNVTRAAVFAAPPAEAEALAQLHVGAPPPHAHDEGTYSRCAAPACAAGVEAYVHAASAAVDERTIFKLTARGRELHLANVRSDVRIGNFSFRNPPHFNEWVERTVRDAHNEVEALLDHLFHHPNVPPFLATRLIQRFTTSNPSPRYVGAVAAAFSSGAYGGRVYSGSYGDLAAALAAVLLDREARAPTLDADGAHGKLREPLLKVVHFLRAMEYASDGREVELYEMSDAVGQAAHASPSVFSFFLPEYQPSGAVADAALVAPEAQVGTAPLMISYLNGMTSLVERGLSRCWDGFGAWRGACVADGRLTFAPSAAGAPAVVDELALLLTRGSLAPHTRAVIEAAYAAELAAEGEAAALRRAQSLFAASAEFHADAYNQLLQTERTLSPTQVSLNRPYKAVVVLFMSGAADTFNMLVPHSQCAQGSPAYASLDMEYEGVRTLAALSKSDLLPISSRSDQQPCGTFGVHPALPFVRQLYEEGEGAFVANVGALVEPVSKEEYRAKSKALPPSLFAHNIMQRAAWSVHAQYGAAKGLLGRIVDQLRTRPEPYAAELYSISGTNKMVEANTHPGPNFIDRTRGVPRFRYLDDLASDLANLTSRQSGSIFAETHAQLLNSTLETTERVGGLLDEVELTQTFSTTSISRQFQQVAKLIKFRKYNLTERDAFYVELGGFDTHSNMLEDLHENFEQINEALRSFVLEMRAQGVWDDVVVVTSSDFGRTLTSNGLGTDHAWGGNHVVLGGSLNGSQIFGQYPRGLDDDAELNIGRGRLIPTMSWEGMWAPIARWFGVDEDAMPTVLPNEHKFDNIIPKEMLFKESAS